jgi:hypothetical protein
MRRQLLVFVACFSSLSFAQTAEPAPAPAAATPQVSAPPVVGAQEDSTIGMTDDGRILFGASKREVDAPELFRALGRADLVAQSEANVKRRFGFTIAAITVGVVAVGVGVALFATTPDPVTPACLVNAQTYNEVCLPAKVAHQVGGGTAIGGGLLVAGILASIAYWARPEVFSKWDLKKFINEHNASIGAPAITLQLLPTVGAGVEGLVAQGTF